MLSGLCRCAILCVNYCLFMENHKAVFLYGKHSLMKQPAPNAATDYLDILYAHRNKQYGSYELRRHYPARLKLALVLLLSFLATGILIPLLAFDKQPVKITQPRLRADTLTYFSKPLEMPEKPKAPKPAQRPKTNVATQKFTGLTVVPDKLVKNPPVSIDSLQGKEISHTTQQGNKADGTAGAVAANTKTGNGDGNTEPPEKTTVPIRIAEKMPAPPYSVDAFLAKNLRYPEAARDAGLEGKVVLEFVVAEDGSIVSPRILRSAGKELDAEALRVLQLMPNWQPGMVGGKAVKVYFVLPITFRLD